MLKNLEKKCKSKWTQVLSKNEKEYNRRTFAKLQKRFNKYKNCNLYSYILPSNTNLFLYIL